MKLFLYYQTKSNNNHTSGSTVASLVSSVANFGATSGGLNLSRSPRITMVSPQGSDAKQDSFSVRL